MAVVNQGVDMQDVEMKQSGNAEFSQESKLTGTGSPRRGKFAIQTQMEKILLVVGAILLILCIIFIALLAKEASSNDDSSSPSNSGRSCKCVL